MQDSTIIWKFLAREYHDEHPAIYLYCCGNLRSPITAITKIMELVMKIFYPAISESYIKTVVIGFLNYKKKQYIKGEIKLKPLY